MQVFQTILNGESVINEGNMIDEMVGEWLCQD